MTIYRLIGGIWRALSGATVTPPSPPTTSGGFGTSGFGTGPYGN